MATASVCTTRIAINNILLTTDFSEASQAALRYACNLARLCGSKIFVTHVVPAEPYLAVPLEPIPIDLDVFWEREKQSMREFTAAKALEEIPHESILQRGELWDVVSSVIEKHHVDLVIAGTHGRKGLKRVVLGSVAEKIYRQAKCPVLTLRPEVAGMGWQLKRILFATDFSDTSLHALPYALSFAEENHATLILLNVAPLVPYQYKQSIIESTSKRLQALMPDEASCPADFVVCFDFAAEAILQIARDRQTDLIVLGVNRRAAVGLSSHLPWATASEVVSAAPCPVLTVRAV
ncbi:MAG: universal stress protein [Acidobacteriaceae bacterium]|nr:universal stress protein [Acidobacteriaceae bacterium]